MRKPVMEREKERETKGRARDEMRESERGVKDGEREKNAGVYNLRAYIKLRFMKCARMVRIAR